MIKSLAEIALTRPLTAIEMHIVDLEHQVLELKKERLETHSSYGDLAVKYTEIKEKAKAWDDLEALVSKCNSDRFDFRISLGYISVTYYGDVITTFSEKFSKEAVSNALESIKDNDNE